MADLVAELERYLRGEPIKSRPVGAIGRIWRWYRRHPDSSAQVAGVYAVLCGILLFAWALEGLVVYGTGIDPSPDAADAILEILLTTVVVYLPLVVAGVYIIRGYQFAIWLGFFAFTAGLVLVVLGLTEVIDYSGVFGDTRLRIGLLTLLGNLCLVGVLTQFVALFSRLIGRYE
jgi:hypothetical protein